MRQLSIQPIIKISLLLGMILPAMACNNGPQKRFKPFSRDINQLFEIDSVKRVQNKMLKPEDVFDPGSPIYKKLQAEGILNENSTVLFTGTDCISLVNSHKKNAGIENKRITDTILMYNGNIGKFACGINDLYTLNQDENIAELSFSVYKINEYLNLFIVHN